MKSYTVKLKVTNTAGDTSVKIITDYIKVCPAGHYKPAGNYSGVWSAAGSPYFIGGEIVVPLGQTLTLEPGVILKLRTNSTDWDDMTVPPTRENTDFGFITVYGTLAAQGTASDSIVFTRMGNTGWWGLIHMTKTANPGGAPIKYCKMEHASFMNTGIGNLVKTIAGLALDSNSITVSNSRFRNNMIGIQCYKSHAAISNNDISLNGAGIICNHSTPTIAGNSISGNGSGIGCSLQSAPAIKSNIISSNPDNGIYALSGSAVTAVSNTIADNGYGLFSQYAGQITIDNSILWGNSMGSVNDTLPAITHSCVAYTSLYPGTGNRNADPRFTGTPGNPYALTWSNFPVKTIQGTMSPCINTGNPNLNGTGGTWLTDPADRDPDMSRPDMGARYFHQAPLVTVYNPSFPEPQHAQHKYHDFGPIQIPLQSPLKSFAIQNVADRLNDCPVNTSGSNGDQFYLANPADSLIHLLPDTTVSVNVYFQPDFAGELHGLLTAGAPVQYSDTVTLKGTGQGVGTVRGHVKTPSPDSIGVAGVVITVTRTNPAPYVSFTDTTEVDGSFILTNVGVGYYTVTPSHNPAGTPHTFNPTVTPAFYLNPTTIMVKDFTDLSFYPVSGDVSYLNSDCPSKNRLMLMDGQPLYPVVNSNNSGYYAIHNVPIGNHTFQPNNTDGHTFKPQDTTISVMGAIAGLKFKDKFTHKLSGYIRGGCGIPLADSLKVIITCTNSCKPPVTLYTDSSGFYSVDLPPYDYTVAPEPIMYMGQSYIFSLENVDLRYNDAIKNFSIHTTPVIEITGFEAVTNPNGWIILDQFTKYTIGIDIFEPYSGPAGDTMCRVGSGDITILDDLSMPDSSLTVPASDTTTLYSFYAGYPNLAGEGEHPYQKQLQVQYLYDNKVVTNTIWVYIVGQVPRKTVFTTTTPEIPLLILRDPPGDESYSFFSQTSTVSTAIGISAKSVKDTTNFTKRSLGLDFSASKGVIISIGFNIDVIFNDDENFTATHSQNSITENQLTISTTTTRKTRDDGLVVGEKGDLFIGGAMNLIYGITDVLSIEDTIAIVNQDIIFIPDGFETTYTYFGYVIENTIIPSLYLIGDLISAHRWEDFLELNRNLKENAIDNDVSLSISGGILEYSSTMEKTEITTQECELTLDTVVAKEAGLLVQGVGGSSGKVTTVQITTGKSEVNTTSNSTTVGYVLGDDDPLDLVWVDLKTDRVYGTPVFTTVSGQSSCPYEENTVPRDSCQLSPHHFQALAIPPDSTAYFTLNLINKSQTSEAWTYELDVMNETTHGAIVTAAGQSNWPIPFYISAPNVNIPVDISISRPAGFPRYDFSGIKLRLASPCDAEIAEALGEDPKLADWATFDVHFTPPCSPVSIFSPADNFVINQANNNVIPVTIIGYDLANNQLQEICLDYSPDNGNIWTRLVSIPKANIQGTSLVVNWDVTGYNDGIEYMLRAIAKCTGGDENSSVYISGVIDLHSPQVLSPSMPSDEKLDIPINNVPDEISFTFNEPLNPATVTINNCKLLYAENGVQVNATVYYVQAANKIIFTINPGLSYFIENRYLKSMVAGVTDLYGNPLADTVSWTFLVDQGPLRWIGDRWPFEVVNNNSVFEIISLLKNESSKTVNYSVLAPNWSTPTPPLYGSLSPAPSGSRSMHFDSDTMNPGIPHYDTIFASTLGFPPEKIYVSFFSPAFVEMTVTPPNLAVPGAAGTTLFEISSNVIWSLSDSVAWLSAVPSFGYNDKTITVSFDENMTGFDRVGIITLTAEGISPDILPPVIITVTQAAMVPATLQLSGDTVFNGEVECYKAIQTITAQNFIIENGGVVNLIAGNKIRLLPHLEAAPGSAFRAWISPTDNCYGQLAPLTANGKEVLLPVENATVFSGTEKFFKVYPNPTTGEFTLELMKFEEYSNITVNIYGMQGNKIQSRELQARKLNTLNISNSKPGIYLVQVIGVGETGMMKVLKQ